MVETSRCSARSTFGGNSFLQKERLWASSRSSLVWTMFSNFDYIELKLLEDSRSSRCDAVFPKANSSPAGHDGEDDHQVGDGFVYESLEGDMARNEWGAFSIVKFDNWARTCVGPESRKHDERVGTSQSCRTITGYESGGAKQSKSWWGSAPTQPSLTAFDSDDAPPQFWPSVPPPPTWWGGQLATFGQ